MRCGPVRKGTASSGQVTVADGSKEHFGVPCCSLRRVDRAKQGGAWPGEVVQGRVRYGILIVADGSTEHFGALCCSPWKADKARSVQFR